MAISSAPSMCCSTAGAASSSPGWASPASSAARSRRRCPAPERPRSSFIRPSESIRRIGARLITITGTPKSTLGKAADVTLDCGIAEEACPMNLVPTASTTAALALGDALAMTLLVRKGFREEHFASLHPGGKIGKKLMTVEAVMQGGDAAPRVGLAAVMPDVIHEMSSKRLGMTCVIDGDGRLAG